MPGRLPISILVGLAACTWALVLVVTGSSLGWDFAKPFSLVVGVISIALVTFDRWLWRWPFVRSVVGRPDLEGTYWGVIRSEWVNPETGQKPAPIPAAIVVKQSYTGLVLTLFTAESASSTIAATLDEGLDGRFAVAGLYRNEPRLSVQERSRMHHGGLRLNVAGEAGERLDGSYWTDRGTQGEMAFSRVSVKRVGDFAAAEALAQGASGSA